MELNLAPELNERTKEWAEDTVRKIAIAALSEVRSRKRDMICYIYYNGAKTDEEFEYLNEVGDYVYPAKVRFFQIIRPKIDLQLSKLSRRALNYATIASDEKSQKERFDQKLHHYLDFFSQKIQASKQESMEAIQLISEKLQEINQVLKSPAKTAEEAELQQQLFLVQKDLKRTLYEARTHNENIVLLSEDEEEKINHFFKYNYKDIRELGAQKYLKKAMIERDIKRKSLKAFRDQTITGKPLYFVDVCEGEKYPIFEQISPLYTCWSSNSPSGYIQDGSWATYSIQMSVSEIISRFGLSMTKDELKRLKNFQSYSRQSSLQTNYDHAAFFRDSNERIAHSGSSIDKLIDVTYVYWRSPRRITRKSTPNPHVPGKHFTHIISEEEVLNTTLKEGEFIQIRYIDDIYEGVMIGLNQDSIVVNAGPKKNQVYDVDTFKTELPILGYTFADLNDEPYSYIWATKDLQDLYNILMFQAELLTVLSGVKGIVMDKAQRPDDMTPSEWVYQRKMGVTWIDSMKKKFQRFPTFNQFTQYDDTLSQSILYIMEMARNIEDMAGQIIGVSRQSIGQTVSTDQVGTNKMSIDQSTLVNEIQFYTHFDLLGKALSRFMNCAREQGVIDDVISFVNNDLTSEDFVMPKDVFEGRKYDIIVSNSVNELDFIEDFKNIAINERRMGGISLHDLIKVYQGNTLKEIEETLEFASKTAMQAAQNAEANRVNAEAQNEQALKQMDLQYKQLSDKMNAELKQLELQMKQKEGEMAMIGEAIKAQADEKQRGFDNAIKAREMELKGIDVENRVVDTSFKNQLNALTQKIDTLLGSRKLDIEEKKVNKMNKTT